MGYVWPIRLFCPSARVRTRLYIRVRCRPQEEKISRWSHWLTRPRCNPGSRFTHMFTPPRCFCWKSWRPRNCIGAAQMPPKPKEYVSLMWGGHGWICFSLDGQYAWCHTPDMYDARTKQRVALLKDQNGQLFASSKFFEVQFRDGKVVRVGNEFGLVRAQVP
jgi:hypothetical protein